MKAYFTILNVQEYTPKLNGLLYPLPFFLIGLIAVLVIYINGKQNNKKLTIIPLFVFVIISVLFVTGYFKINDNNELTKLKELYANNNYEIIEGVVNNFDPMPYGGHKLETFDVNGIKFSYSDYYSVVGYKSVFRKTRSHGGPIYEGAYVRIYYIHDERFSDNFIIGLWIKEE